jgi:hypothetical protein
MRTSQRYTRPHSWHRYDDHDQQVEYLLRHGWRIEQTTPFGTYLLRGEPVNHVLHLLLTVFTAGLWAPIRLLKTLGGGQHHRLVNRTLSPPAAPAASAAPTAIGAYVPPNGW